MNINNFGVLYIVATPIGNLQDMSFRAVETLKSVDYIAAEDTRHSIPLLQNFGIATAIFSLHEHNERDRVALLLDYLKNGKSIALISDAGTPLINDPGYFLVQEARAKGIRVSPIPGACALIAALCASGLPTDRFVFEGFLPAKTKARCDSLTNLLSETRTIIVYEAPHRILDLLQDIQKIFGAERKVVIARELTKKFETILSGTVAEVLAVIETDANQQRGEFVVLIEGAASVPSIVPSEKLLALLLENLALKQAVEITAKITGERKNDLYEIALKMKAPNANLPSRDR